MSTQFSLFLRTQVGFVALPLADQIHCVNSFKYDKVEVFIPLSVDLPLSVLNTFLIVRPVKRNASMVNDHPGHLISL